MRELLNLMHDVNTVAVFLLVFITAVALFNGWIYWLFDKAWDFIDSLKHKKA